MTEVKYRGHTINIVGTTCSISGGNFVFGLVPKKEGSNPIETAKEIIDRSMKND